MRKLKRSVGRVIGKGARGVNQRLGLMAWLSGEPRPPLGGFDLDGEKLMDWGWLCVHLPRGSKTALEIGPGKSPIIPAMLALGYDVVAVDFDDAPARTFSGFRLINGDFTKIQFDKRFEVIVACSVVEHIGLAGRYGSIHDPSGDLVAMKKMRDLLDQDGVLLLTVPVGRDTIYSPFHRIYGKERLPVLMDGFEITESHYLIKEPWGPWHSVTSDEALDYATTVQRYAIGEFVLRRAKW